jgi:hypothetical protein
VDRGNRFLAWAYLRIHPKGEQPDWAAEFSHNDAGWLHVFMGENQGGISRANCDDQNYPARIATLAAGLPMLQYGNQGSVVATQLLIKNLGMGVLGAGIGDLPTRMRDKTALSVAQNKAWGQRMRFSFDHHAEELISFFRLVTAIVRAGK